MNPGPLKVQLKILFDTELQVTATKEALTIPLKAVSAYLIKDSTVGVRVSDVELCGAKSVLCIQRALTSVLRPIFDAYLRFQV